MQTEEHIDIVSHFEDLEDPRARLNQDHKSIDILVIAICATICGADACVAIEQFGLAKQGRFATVLRLGNHGQLHEDVILLFDDPEQSEFSAYEHEPAKTVDSGHGRIEVRQAWTITDPTLIAALRTSEKWPQLSALVKIRAERYLEEDNSVEDRYFIASYQATAAQKLNHVRTHWAVENSLHRVLGIAFSEDEYRLRKDHGAHNFAILRHVALNRLKQDKQLNSASRTRGSGRVGTRIFCSRYCVRSSLYNKCAIALLHNPTKVQLSQCMRYNSSISHRLKSLSPLPSTSELS